MQPEALIPGDVRFGTAGRSTAQGPGIIGTDLSARKITALSERIKTEFRAEFFGAFNHPNWGLPTRDLGNANFGRVTSSSGERIIQFGLKLFW